MPTKPKLEIEAYAQNQYGDELRLPVCDLLAANVAEGDELPGQLCDVSTNITKKLVRFAQSKRSTKGGAQAYIRLLVSEKPKRERVTKKQTRDLLRERAELYEFACQLLQCTGANDKTNGGAVTLLCDQQPDLVRLLALAWVDHRDGTPVYAYTTETLHEYDKQ